jgi:hypothetical protein
MSLVMIACSSVTCPHSGAAGLLFVAGAASHRTFSALQGHPGLDEDLGVAANAHLESQYPDPRITTHLSSRMKMAQSM